MASCDNNFTDKQNKFAMQRLVTMVHDYFPSIVLTMQIVYFITHSYLSK